MAKTFGTSRLILLFLLGLLCAYAETAAQSHSTSSAPPEVVTLSLDEFQNLYYAAKVKDAERELLDQQRRQEQTYNVTLQQLAQRNIQKHRDVFPTNFQVLEHTAMGSFCSPTNSGTGNDMVVFDMQMTVRVMQDSSSSWTVIPLVANTTVAAEWQAETLDDEGEFVPVDTITNAEVMLVRSSFQAMQLVTSKAGVFRIQYQVYARVKEQRNHIREVGLSQFLYPLSDFQLSLPPGSGSAVRELNVHPLEAVWRVVETEERLNSTSTDTSSVVIHVTLPLTAEGIEIRWLDVSDQHLDQQEDQDDAHASEDSSGNLAPQVTVSHDVMHAVGEGGMVRSSHILEYTSTSELSASSTLFALKGGGSSVRITSVEGHALQTWELVSSDSSEQIIRIHWKRSHLETAATLLLQTETTATATIEGTLIQLPHIECVGVLRQVGHAGVVQDANVEVHQHSLQGSSISRCEPSELSSQLRLNMDRPIVLSYKYWNPTNTSITIEAQEHAPLETLEATVDRMHYKAVVTDTHTVHSLMVVLQSTKLQYLQVLGLPSSGAGMVTLLVNSIPAKPVACGTEDGCMLVPLLVGLDAEAANQGRTLKTSVELNYISTHGSPLTGAVNGTLALTPPHLLLPISVLTMHVRLPQRYDYNFSAPSDSSLAFPIPTSYSYQTGKRVVEKDYAFSFKDDVAIPEEDDQGPKAVKIMTPNTGRSFYFHQLLVVDTQFTLTAVFQEPKKPEATTSWWSGLLGLVSSIKS